MSKKILITGGAGFIGSNLCKKLLERGDEVICLDNLFTGRKENIEDLFDYKGFSFIEHDVVNPIFIDCDEIYNLACPASPVHYQIDPVKTTKTCFDGAINFLELAKKNNARILQSSTSEVYGEPLEHPQKETYRGNVNPIGIRACYDEGKRVAETLFFDYHRQYGVDIKVVRIFNTYGPKMRSDDGRVVSNFIIQALKGEDITIYGDGSQTRSFCYVDDLIEGFVKFMDCKKELTGPCNLGNPGEFTIKQLAEMVIDMTGSSSKLIYLPLPQDDPTQRKPNIDLANKEFGWTPKIQLKEGLLKTISYFEKEIK